jgi:SlyX protein
MSTAPDQAANQALEARIDELETQLAFQEDLFRRLDETVARQDQELRLLKEQFKALGRRMAELRDAAPDAAAGGHEVPPHY